MGGCTYPHLLNLPSNDSGQALNSPFAQQEPQLSGDYLAFVSDRNGSQDVYLYDLPHRRLVDLPGLNAIDMAAEHPSVSADGRFIVFAASRQGRQDIYLYDRQIQHLRNLTDGIEASVRNPSISADGQRIAYESNASGRWDIVLCDRSGKPLDLLPADAAAKSNSAAAPDALPQSRQMVTTADPPSPLAPEPEESEPVATPEPAIAPSSAPPPAPPLPTQSNESVTFPEAFELTGQQPEPAEEWENKAPDEGRYQP